MKRLILLLIIAISYLSAEPNTSNYISYDEFLKIKSYFNENGCEGIEHFLQSSKDLNVSDKWYYRENNGNEVVREIKNLPYQDLCLLGGSTQFEADGEIKDATVKFMKNKNYWENNFPKNEKIIALVFKTPIQMRKTCTVPEWKSSAYYIIFHKENGKIIRKVYSNNNADQNCINSQLFDIIKTKSKIGTIINVDKDIKSSIIVHENMDKNSKVIDKITNDQKVLILGAINKSSFVYYNKKTKDNCNLVKESCDSGWVDTSLIAENR